ncbi:MarR family winged helix-turn-helix transcriptional regulator [Streptacidiphilus jiangxiensis]|uniref:DNA-binding transcriptional regulator, MarR family n=1 Tax=Streptacidiphilus jiangxiensis TaxID=235985 RepID=A0A1H7ZE14_STRJI|nr:MarR family transcriptional regulator [Streptacidiphilus jiangxiensis]SEM56244.1 DNA-binding transcriptional regulator, MarR family [Streptacidiphilus jiangxiensis]
MSEHRSEPSLLYAAKRLELAIRAHLDDMLRESGVTTMQYTALTVLAHRDGISAAQLARDSFVTPQSMADMLRLLDSRGLISRRPNPESKRELLVHITDEGRELLTTYADAAAAIENRMTDGLSARQVTEFRTAIHAMWEHLR